MPQKRNPDALELVRGKCGRVLGQLHSLMVTVKGLPMAYNRDLQEDKAPVFEAADQLAGSLEVLKLCVDTTTVHGAAMERAAEEGWTCATALAEHLSRRGVPFHRAHQVVGALVLRSVRDGKKPAEWTAEALAEIAPEFGAEAVELLSARRALENHTAPGGTAPASVAKALTAAERRLQQMSALR
jgi:argininosuccinate lyase